MREEESVGLNALLLKEPKPARAGNMSVFELLRKRHEPPAWAFLEEVRNQTGYARTVRTADAMAMSLYPSRGLHLHGFEVKVSRADWVRELRDPAKADEIAAFCHFWWLAVDDADIVRDGELPATWGLLVSNGKTLKQVKEPMFNKEAKDPTHRFLGAILRKFAATDTDFALLERAKREGHQAGMREGMDLERSRSTDGRFQTAFEELRAKVTAFENASGLDISSPWNKGNVGAVVRMLLNDWDLPVKMLDRLATQAKDLSDKCAAACTDIRRALPAVPAAEGE